MRALAPAITSVLVLALGACGEPLTLPDPPKPVVLRLDGVSPLEGYAGTRVTLSGLGLGGDRSAIEVRFGAGSAVAPDEVSDDGSSLVATVPDDATTGAVTVTTALGRVTSTQAFSMRGLGRLRLGVVKASADLRPELRAAFVHGEGLVLFDRKFDRIGLRATDGTIGPLFDEQITAIAAAAGGGVVAAIDGRAELRDCAGGVARLWLAGEGVGADPICLSSPGLTPEAVPPDVAVSPDGARVLVASSDVLWAVDTADGRVRRIALPEHSGTADVAFAGPKLAFAYHDGGLVRVDWDTATVEDTGLVDAGRVEGVLGGSSAGRLVVSHELRVLVLDATRSPPTVLADFVSAGRPARSLAISPDGTRLAIVRPDESVAVWDVARPEPAMLGSERIEGAAEVHASAFGSFSVGGRGRVVFLAQETGRIADEIPVIAGLSRPIVRRVEVPGEPEPIRVVELVAESLGAAARLRADNLHFIGTRWLLPSRDGFTALAAEPDGETLFVQRGRSVYRVKRNADGLEVQEREPFFQGPLRLVAGTRVSVAPGSKAVFVTYDDGAWTTQWRTAFVDASKDFASYRDAPSVEAGESLLPFAMPPPPLVEEDGTVYFLDGDRARVHTVAALGAGSTEPVRDVSFADEGGDAVKVIAAGLGAGRLIALLRPESSFSNPLGMFRDFWMRAVPPEGPSVRSGEIDTWNSGQYWDLNVAPGGRRLWALKAIEQERRLVSMQIDPYTATGFREDAPVALPPGTSMLVPFADGSGMVAVDRENDRILLLE